MASLTATLNLYKVDSTFEGDTVVHTTGIVCGPRIVALKTTWKRMEILGAGAFGVVWCEQEEDGGGLRAVKVIPRKELNIREVHALVEVQDVPRPPLSY